MTASHGGRREIKNEGTRKEGIVLEDLKSDATNEMISRKQMRKSRTSVVMFHHVCSERNKLAHACCPRLGGKKKERKNAGGVSASN